MYKIKTRAVVHGATSCLTRLIWERLPFMSCAYLITCFYVKSNTYRFFYAFKDALLGSTLSRAGSTFNEDLSKMPPFTKEGYESVPKVYIMCKDDKLLPLDFQKWMIKNSQVNQVKEIEGADHVPMSSKPQELFRFLLEAGERYQ